MNHPRRVQMHLDDPWIEEAVEALARLMSKTEQEVLDTEMRWIRRVVEEWTEREK